MNKLLEDSSVIQYFRITTTDRVLVQNRLFESDFNRMKNNLLPTKIEGES